MARELFFVHPLPLQITWKGSRAIRELQISIRVQFELHRGLKTPKHLHIPCVPSSGHGFDHRRLEQGDIVH